MRERGIQALAGGQIIEQSHLPVMGGLGVREGVRISCTENIQWFELVGCSAERQGSRTIQGDAVLDAIGA